MKLSNTALDSITLHIRTRIALELGCSVDTVDRWIRKNKTDGDLTKASVINILKEETKLSDQEILEEESEGIES